MPFPRRVVHATGWMMITLCTTLLVAWQAHAESNRVRFPTNLDQLVHYATVNRGNVTEHILTSRAAIDAVQKNQPIPDGTQFVLVDYRDDKVYRYFVMENGSGWGQDFDERRRTGNWQFQWFWPNKSINTSENTARCQSCHQSQQDQNYLYTHEQLRRFRP